MSTANQGAKRERRVRDELIAQGWHLIARSAASKGPADLVMAHPEYGIALIQVGTAKKALGPDDRTRLLAAAHLCSALPILARIAPRQATHYALVTDGPPKEWTTWKP